MKILAIIVALFFLVREYGQLIEQKNTLVVNGVAQVTIKPDLAVLNISVSEIKPTMGEAIKALGEKSAHYNTLLKKMGFSKEDIKTTNFAVSANKIFRDIAFIDSGYIASQNIRLEFSYNQATLQKIIYEFAKSEKPIAFNFNFELSEQLKQEVQSQIIESAVKNAKEKATNIAKATDLRLVEIKNITHGHGIFGNNEITFFDKAQRHTAMTSADGSPTLNLTPNDLIFQDSLAIVWEIR